VWAFFATWAPRAEQQMEKLKLIAFDGDDLAVISAHLQDATLRAGDMAYLPRHKRFALIADRFHWTHAVSEDSTAKSRQRRSALRLERVLGARFTGIDLEDERAPLSLLAIQYAPTAADDPKGFVTLYFAGEGAIRLEVECVEAEFQDLEDVWQQTREPEGQDDESSALR